ncbi:sulfate reduction electron transfer complex DsrMKJOP subunit DsrJ [Desulfosporosinus meridiei]|uniref:Putative sulfite reductase-associated electron transfer protein DsrJ n=1 Tax=Desulfosporosinus meridiei (strain ATCC BAA-275 / DSM 13257 / KCTC 12902 / NCIMB 13706 / S10) TaxID=768704 RepID=J7IWW8_DESMD|nr:sulfate reduction electron transfer complex DsrMKJOP subunit DsrJ [Desulfosporosinus meridiei]AFQ43618.1 putative sulfite reductase-associated electron transfer protein DsrJ [Desulfosporosinus meridiei DSM 13257]
MYKGGRIIASLVIFVGIFTIPFFYNLGKANAGPEIDAKQLADFQSIEPSVNMIANHPQMFNQWRDELVRNGKTVYVNSEGKEIDISIENLEGADPSGQFCVSCHDYTAVEPTCWDCHSGPEGATK